jgi:hypothetical protein
MRRYVVEIAAPPTEGSVNDMLVLHRPALFEEWVSHRASTKALQAQRVRNKDILLETAQPYRSASPLRPTKCGSPHFTGLNIPPESSPVDVQPAEQCKRYDESHAVTEAWG